MGKMRKRLFAKISDMIVNRRTSKKQLRLSIVSLVLASLFLVSATYCWYALSKGTGTAKNVNLTVGNGLRVNDLGDASQKFKDDSFLLPASSVDGRNLFFPTDGTDFSNETAKMTFRSANAGDRNYSYVQLDFNLTAEANYTGIYLDKTSNVTIHVPGDASSAYKAAAEKAQKAIRTAIYYDRMDAPVIFTSQMNPTSVRAVKDIDRTTGRFLESGNQAAVPFKDYSYGKRQLAMLDQGETLPFSLIIWLEGTDENCISDAVMLKQLVLNIKFTTSWDNTEEIIFEDTTENAEIKAVLDAHPEYSLVLNYNNKAHKIYNMKFTMQKLSAENNKKWKCNLPGNAYNDLTFQIIDDSNNKVVYEWNKMLSGASTLNRGTATTYYADRINQTPNDDTNPETDTSSEKSRGHWFDGDIEQHGEGHDGGIYDGDDW